MATPSIPSSGQASPGLTLPSVRWAKDQLIRKTRYVMDTLVRAYRGEFVYLQLLDTDPIVGGKVLNMYNVWGILKIDDMKSATSVIGIDLQKSMITSGNNIRFPRDASEDALIVTEKTSAENYINVVRDGANDYSFYLIKSGFWHECCAKAGCRVYKSLSQIISNSTWTAITFDSELFDTDTIHSVSSNTSRLTCKTKGVYTISGHIEFAEDDPAVGYRAVAIKLNGTTYIAKVDKELCNINPCFSITTLYELAVNDYVELFVYHTSGAALDVNAQAQWSPHFAMQRIS